MDCVANNPPQPEQPSYELFVKEKAEVLKSLADRALMIANKTFNFIPGMKQCGSRSYVRLPADLLRKKN